MGEARGGWKWGAVAVVVVVLGGCGHGDGLETDLGQGASGSRGGVGVSNTVATPSEMNVGDIMPIDFGDSLSQVVEFGGVESSAKFILVVGSNNAGGAGTSVQLSSDLALEEGSGKAVVVDDDAQAESEDEGFGATEIFHSWLRAAEGELAFTESSPALSGSFAKAATAKDLPEVGDTETFRVLSSLTSVSSYVEATGSVRCVGENIILYTDTRVTNSQLDDDDIDYLCETYDRQAGEEAILFGDPSDVNGDRRTAIFMTPQVNLLGKYGKGFVTGYFYAGELYARTGSNPVSNFREIVHLMVPDPSGQYGSAISKSFCLTNLCTAVFPHELQHAISYNQHVFVAEGSAEASWLNEAMSHHAEDYFGFGTENPSRYALFLSSPSTTGIVTSGSPDLQERGAGYLFLRFLCEQSSDCDGFLRRLEQTSEVGVANLEQAFAGADDFDQFSEFFGRWTVAVAMTDRGITTDSRYVYRARTISDATGNWNGALLIGDPEDNRGTVLDGVHLSDFNGYHSADVTASAAKYYSITTIPNQIELAGSEDGGNFGMLIRTE